MSATSAVTLLLLALLLDPSSASGHAPASIAAIRGAVVDAESSRPIGDAVVALQGTRWRAMTDGEGRFGFDNVPAGEYILEVEHVTYATRAEPLAVQAGTEIFVEVRLARSPIGLEPLVVTARASKLVDVGFYERSRRGVGVFFTREEIAAQNITTVGDLLSSVPGLRRRTDHFGASTIRSRGQKSIMNDCGIQYFLDGMRTRLDMVGVDHLEIGHVSGIEVYRGSSEVPIQFGSGRSICGAVLIWTRDGTR